MLTRRMMMGVIAAAVLPLSAHAAEVQIVATTGMIADAARVLTGQPVTALIGPGMDPHGHRPTRSDIVALNRADLVLYHGLNLEAQFHDLLVGLAKNKPVVAVAEALPQEQLLAGSAYPDPHIWFDPKIWTQVVAGMEAPLAGYGPDIAEKSSAYQAEIVAIGQYAAGVLASVPPERRILVTAHDAFAYFGRAFGFEVEGVQGISTESEAGLARIAELVDLLVDRQIPAVFVESSVSDRALRALIEGAAAKGHKVVIGGELFSDAMGREGSYEGTWIGMMDHNATTIARALGGEAPESGAVGRLGAAG